VKCYVCGRGPDETLDEHGKMKVELRPYGPNGANVCFTCAMHPKRRRQTERNYVARLKACVVPVIGTDAGVFEGKDLVPCASPGAGGADAKETKP
jgi:hypothetical protein